MDGGGHSLPKVLSSFAAYFTTCSSILIAQNALNDGDSILGEEEPSSLFER